MVDSTHYMFCPLGDSQEIGLQPYRDCDPITFEHHHHEGLESVGKKRRKFLICYRKPACGREEYRSPISEIWFRSGFTRREYSEIRQNQPIQSSGGFTEC
jgi:hypothetical protein